MCVCVCVCNITHASFEISLIHSRTFSVVIAREKKMSRTSAIKVLNHAMTGEHGVDNCQKFVDILGLRNIFPLFMKGPKVQKKVGPSRQELDGLYFFCIYISVCRADKQKDSEYTYELNHKMTD